MRKWIDEHPSRYAAISLGDFVGVTGHFAEVAALEIRELALAEETACGRPLDWRSNPKKFPICGVVDCEECLQRMKDDVACV